MKTALLVLFASVFSFSAYAKDLKFNYPNEELSKVLEVYSKETGQKFVVDPGVRGKASFLNPKEISQEEAFNQISMALAVNGFGISKINDMMVVRSARAIQRTLIESSTELPALQPERLATWIVNLKHISSDDVLRNLRNLSSKDGELNSLPKTNQLLITDFTSNLHRVAAILKDIDVPASSKKTAK